MGAFPETVLMLSQMVGLGVLGLVLIVVLIFALSGVGALLAGLWGILVRKFG